MTTNACNTCRTLKNNRKLYSEHLTSVHNVPARRSHIIMHPDLEPEIEDPNHYC